MRNTKICVIADRLGTLTDTFVANATTNLLTSSSAHGLKVGDMIVLTEDNTLPTPLVAATVYYVVEVPSTTTFKISATSHGPAIDITSTTTDTDTWTMHDIGNNINVMDYRHCVVAVHGYDSCNIDIGFVGSIGKSVSDDGAPDFSAASAYNNSWSYIEIIGLRNGTAVDGGAAQISQIGTNKHEYHELNINGLKWLNIIMSGWSAGNVTIICMLFND